MPTAVLTSSRISSGVVDVSNGDTADIHPCWTTGPPTADVPVSLQHGRAVGIPVDRNLLRYTQAKGVDRVKWSYALEVKLVDDRELDEAYVDRRVAENAVVANHANRDPKVAIRIGHHEGQKQLGRRHTHSKLFRHEGGDYVAVGDYRRVANQESGADDLEERRLGIALIFL